MVFVITISSAYTSIRNQYKKIALFDKKVTIFAPTEK